jgi:hypothetical protein
MKAAKAAVKVLCKRLACYECERCECRLSDDSCIKQAASQYDYSFAQIGAWGVLECYSYAVGLETRI